MGCSLNKKQKLKKNRGSSTEMDCFNSFIVMKTGNYSFTTPKITWTFADSKHKILFTAARSARKIKWSRTNEWPNILRNQYFNEYFISYNSLELKKAIMIIITLWINTSFREKFSKKYNQWKSKPYEVYRRMSTIGFSPYFLPCRCDAGE